MCSSSKLVTLPKPDLMGTLPLENCLSRRRSARNYVQESLNLRQVSQLLWAAQGITIAPDFRTAPSGGALYPLDIYLVSGDVEGLSPSTYRYSPKDHLLEQIGHTDQRSALSAAALGQECVARAPVSLVCAAVYERSTVKYGERGVRYTMIESGHVSQNVYLQAASLDLGTVIVGAFDDDRVRDVLGLGADSAPLWIMPLGRRR